MSSSIKNFKKNQEDILDVTLRPRSWEEYIGQEKVKQNLKIIIAAAKKRGEPIEHLLFYGGSGLGKTTLAHLVAKEIGKEIKVISGPAVERAGDLAAILTNLEEGSVLFCDEIHRLSRVIEEYLYPAMEDFKLNLVLGKGPMARTMEVKLPHFTLIGATTRLALVSGPLRSRFGAIFGLNFYTVADIKKILERSAQILNIEAEDEALEIDELGLTLQDRRILEAIIKKFNGGPVGLQALAAACAEEEDTILDIYEPYLMRIGFIERTPRGRVATKLAYQHLGISFKETQRSLL